MPQPILGLPTDSERLPAKAERYENAPVAFSAGLPFALSAVPIVVELVASARVSRPLERVQWYRWPDDGPCRFTKRSKSA